MVSYNFKVPFLSLGNFENIYIYIYIYISFLCSSVLVEVTKGDGTVPKYPRGEYMVTNETGLYIRGETDSAREDGDQVLLLLWPDPRISRPGRRTVTGKERISCR